MAIEGHMMSCRVHLCTICEWRGKHRLLFSPSCVNAVCRLTGCVYKNLQGIQLLKAFSYRHFLLIGLIMVLTVSSAQELCTSWGEGETLGHLPAMIDESSGMRFSLQFPQRLYHTNDSWNSGPVFFVSDMQGQDTRVIHLEGVSGLHPTIDTEALDVGMCPSGQCIFIADIGDNVSERSQLHLLIIPEPIEGQTSSEARVLTLNYPDGAHDAESFAVHPNGDIYILTKEVFPIKAPPARLYRLSYADWITNKESHVLSYITSIDLRTLSGSSVEILSHIATDMDISADGKRLLILTYGEVFELELNLSSLDANSVLPSDTPYKKIEVVTLLQQESISYLPEGYGFIYTAESNPNASPLVRVVCR
jgi:hypothetical protein